MASLDKAPVEAVFQEMAREDVWAQMTAASYPTGDVVSEPPEVHFSPMQVLRHSLPRI